MKIKKAIIVTVTILLLAVPVYFFIALYGSGNRIYYISNFESYKNDFQVIADKMLSIKDLSNLSDGSIAWIDYEKNQVICKLNSKSVEITEDEKNSLFNIRNAFDSATVFNRITVYNNRVTFCTEGNWYAVAYMIDGSKPQFMIAPTERFDIKIKKIDKNWYHIISD